MNMIPKVGEPVLIGQQIQWDCLNIFAGVFGNPSDGVIKGGGDRSYVHNLHLCIATEQDRCVVLRIANKGQTLSDWERGPRMVLYFEYPITKCSQDTLKAMTGYDLTDQLMAIVQKQNEKEPTPCR